jgi:hypothetical protein
MDIYSCERCGYETKHKHSLFSHYQRKKQCIANISDKPINILMDSLITKNETGLYQCNYCNRKFNNKCNMLKHKKICKHKAEEPNQEMLKMQQQIETLILQNNEINNEMLLIKTKASSINNTTNNTQNITNINVKLNNFGKENMDAIPESLIGTLFMDLRFRELLANLHCDPNYPENQNVRIKSIKRNTMEIFRNNKWDIMTFTNGLTELLLQGHKIFKDYYKNDKVRILDEDMSEQEIKDALIQLERIEKLSKDEIKPLLIDLQMMLEEYRENGSAIIVV